MGISRDWVRLSADRVIQAVVLIHGVGQGLEKL